MQTNSGELFGRIDSPWRVFVKGFIGTGANTGGQMNDEDFGIPLLGTFAAYSNTISSVSGTINYGAIDAGVNVLEAPSYKVGAFAGYFFLNQDMNAFGCHPLANINCIPNVPTTGSAIISENDKWQAMRVGVSGETRLINRLRLSGDVAYLPVVNFSGVDTHFFGNTGQVASINPEFGEQRRRRADRGDAVLLRHLAVQRRAGRPLLGAVDEQRAGQPHGR